MITPATLAALAPAIAVARARPLAERIVCQRGNRVDPPMVCAINEFLNTSSGMHTNRYLDGMSRVDTAARTLRDQWRTNDGVSLASEPLVLAVLNACDAWINEATVFCGHWRRTSSTFWRKPAIEKLSWKVAWCYASDEYVKQARATIALNNAAARSTGIFEPVPLGVPNIHPYSGFADFAAAAPLLPGGAAGVGAGAIAAAHHTCLLRGDTRGPLANAGVAAVLPGPGVVAAPGSPDGIGLSGFMGRNALALPALSRWKYLPWMDGHACDDTTSTTTQKSLAIGAPQSSRVQATSKPAWLQAAMNAAPNRPAALAARHNLMIRGFVYELGALTAAVHSAHMMGAGAPAVGVEEFFLGIPPACITAWWVVTDLYHTLGPFVFPAPAALPAGGLDAVVLGNALRAVTAAAAGGPAAPHGGLSWSNANELR
ncbi:MAG: hypothetical protein HYX47_16005 [Burkholderiales bacterium]|nr:hypothetical protein [Burkholderiales bacterium]